MSAAAPGIGAEGRLMRRATYASLGTAVLLIVVKTMAWLVTGSVAMLSTLIDSLLDAVASLFNLVAVHHAVRPADEEHRFGHGKLEPLSGLFQSAFITGSAIVLLIEAATRFVEPQSINRAGIGIAVTAFAIVVTLALVRYQRHVVRQSDSVAISADALHYSGDLLINLGVMASLAAALWIDVPWLDPVVAIAVAAYLLWNAYRIGRSSLDMLMDRELPDEERGTIRELAYSNPKVLAVHEMKTRRSGRDTFIQLHLEMDGHLTLLESHAIADSVEERIRAAYPAAEVIIHQDPAGIDEPHPDYR